MSQTPPASMLTSDFDYHLPPELIASTPLADRAASRMLVIHRSTGLIEHRLFSDFPSYLQPQDCVILNNTRVVPARFLTDDNREILRLKSHSPTLWRCMVKPGKRFKLQHQVSLGDATGTVQEVFENGDRLIAWDRPVDEDRYGHLALPHYMERDEQPNDRERYQTVFAAHEGSIAAPTAGLHFTPEILASIPHAFITLHVGVGTFQPVRAERIEDHVMHHEEFDVSAPAALQIQNATRRIAVGTTAMRTLETIARDHGQIIAARGETNLFITPGFQFKTVGALLTNFHLPKSTLMMLVSAFATRDLILEAYRQAVAQRYRFFSYGDCMLIL
ncbi:MAG: tRNA preQ1(34) S-adenosylmethionine ribosyltransferase-isomerase QueA [Verrucomicrobiaceae bacterium]|nr:tRNA preQ1(34) S-adenosylmethionine ribosyltransferase-isomerase QueA [Verrucomicrobiaceae bacterium]